MNEINNNIPNPNMNMDPNRRLKKVKRPINRISPQGQGMPAAPRPQNPGFNPGQQNQQPQRPQPSEVDAFNLDSYIDDNNSLPVVMEDNEVDTGYYDNTPAPRGNNYIPAQPRFINEEDVINEQRALAGIGFLEQTITKKIALIIGISALLLGMFLAKVLFGEQKVVRDGLQGVVINAEVPRGRARCGVAEKTQGCVLYIMNPQRQELNASDFYDLASQLTGRQRFVIETGNMRYSNNKIKPGEIAQFNIPPLQ